MDEAIQELQIDQKIDVLISHGDYITSGYEINPYEKGFYMPLSPTTVEKFKFSKVFLGHIHKPIEIGKIYYPGSPSPVDITETGKRSFIIFDTQTLEVSREYVETSWIYFDETILTYPVDDEIQRIKEKLSSMIENWLLTNDEIKKVVLRLKVRGYTRDKHQLNNEIEKFLKDKGIQIYNNSIEMSEVKVANVTPDFNEKNMLFTKVQENLKIYLESEMKALHIKRISISNVGPIRQWEIAPKLINCIYGLNESGKTFIVEFLIKSFFRDCSYWGYLREFSGNGQVVCIFNGKELKFSLSQDSRKRRSSSSKQIKNDDIIDDIINDEIFLLLVKLLIIKSGDVSIGAEGSSKKSKDVSTSEKGLSKKILLDIFSPKKTFDTIDKKISETVKSAKINQGSINIQRKGEGEDYSDLKEEIEELAGSIKKITEEYNLSQIKEYDIKIRELEDKRELQIKAKKHYAYSLAEKIKRLKNELEGLPTLDDIKTIEKKINDLKNKNSIYDNKEKEAQKIENEIKNLQEYEKNSNFKKEQEDIVHLYYPNS